jgi:hypothetical protein
MVAMAASFLLDRKTGDDWWKTGEMVALYIVRILHCRRVICHLFEMSESTAEMEEETTRPNVSRV